MERIDEIRCLRAMIKTVEADLSSWEHEPDDNYHGVSAQEMERFIERLSISENKKD